MSLILAVVMAGCAGTPVVLAPRPAPARRLPAIQLPPQPVAPGHARVVLGTTDGPMRIEARSDIAFVPPGASSAPTRAGELCVSPCVADLPAGRYRLYLTSADASMVRGDSDEMTLLPGNYGYVRAPGRYEPPTMSKWIGPAVLLALGMVALPVGLLSMAAGNDLVGLGLTGGGAALTIIGGVTAYSATRAIEQDGATTLWRLDDR